MALSYTNIKGLPVDGNYFTEQLWSDAHPWVEVKRTAKTVTVAKVEVEKDPEWIAKFQKEFIVGGFVGHSPNQGEQTWLFKKVDPTITKKLFATKKGWAYHGTKFAEGKAVEFYDYNF
jgi:hypothetical protein